MRTTATAPLPGTQPLPLYSDSDGRPMGDTDYHFWALVTLRLCLEARYAGREDVYVGANLVMYFEEGNPKKRRDPDGLVAKGVRGNHPRRSFRIWEEGVVPCVLFEIASKDTWRVDVNEKPELYAGIGVKEYFVFDPEGCYLDPVLAGWKTVKGKPVPMKLADDGSLLSKQLGLRLAPEGPILRLSDLATGEPILTPDERAEQKQELATLERKRRRAERRRAKQAEQRAEEERQRAEEQSQRAEEQSQRAEEERQRADGLEAEVARLRAALEQKRNGHKG